MPNIVMPVVKALILNLDIKAKPYFLILLQKTLNQKYLKLSTNGTIIYEN